MQVSTMFVSAEAKSTAKGTFYRFKEASGGTVVTNEEGLAALAQQLLNQPVTADINEVTGTKINPHNGRPYVNRYLNAVVAGGLAQPAGPTFDTGNGAAGATFVTQTVAAPAASEITALDRTIWTQSASKVAAHLLQHFPEAERTLLTFDKIVDREVEKYAAAFKGNIDSVAALQGAFGSEVLPDAPNSDDDIPF